MFQSITFQFICTRLKLKPSETILSTLRSLILHFKNYFSGDMKKNYNILADYLKAMSHSLLLLCRKTLKGAERGSENPGDAGCI